ncbi:MAG TPA: 30S ribosomal protein S27ae [Candidatus Poseidoniales archaeon]|nr:MAG: 30S ribosomal protein S27ae [Euryarchaeota archaeon]HHZ74954.1 30S ribosomal protein S27ae [Candidatus Poseidoniales archaeon]PXY75075.1 MAG: 30S ribosomal protein S27ae [Euryarchaeota archaeon]PXY77845.1 MAG: 30S ribosomal protein S27ae [Euryarchaeota archaeon]PXY79678.1 MAG: 30S ribosomal protein S27ae [Euryarchaeota archaeon]
MSNRSSLYTVEDGKLIRKNKHCKICGPGVFLANHSNRTTCGRCGYDATPSVAPVATEPTAEAPAEASSEEE